ncbi:MAG: hypothetical protein LBK82_13000, partial [Planctomycetaceae bacterium]|nr:hypothetical protein [Planctomycetaceae bacterium]
YGVRCPPWTTEKHLIKSVNGEMLTLKRQHLTSNVGNRFPNGCKERYNIPNAPVKKFLTDVF